MSAACLRRGSSGLAQRWYGSLGRSSDSHTHSTMFSFQCMSIISACPTACVDSTLDISKRAAPTLATAVTTKHGATVSDLDLCVTTCIQACNSDAIVNVAGIFGPVLAGYLCNLRWLQRRGTMILGALLTMVFFFA
jgi:NAD-dependent dihydropyrimidine dehydrogenase PreA subunit